MLQLLLFVVTAALRQPRTVLAFFRLPVRLFRRLGFGGSGSRQALQFSAERFIRFAEINSLIARQLRSIPYALLE